MATVYCTCDAPVTDVEHDAGCRRCGLPIDWTPSWGVDVIGGDPPLYAVRDRRGAIVSTHQHEDDAQRDVGYLYAAADGYGVTFATVTSQLAFGRGVVAALDVIANYGTDEWSLMPPAARQLYGWHVNHCVDALGIKYVGYFVSGALAGAVRRTIPSDGRAA